MQDARAARAAMLVLSISLIGLGVYAYYRIGSFEYQGSHEGIPVNRWVPAPLAVLASLVSVASGLAVFALSRWPGRRSLAAAGLLAVSSVVLVAAAAASFYPSTGYYVLRTPITTDSYILQVEAARAIIRGENPYELDYRDALERSIPPDPYTWIYRDPEPPFSTDEITGFVTRFDYMAAAALYYVPPLLLGIPAYVWDGLVAAAGIVLVYRRLSPDAKPLLPALAAAGIFVVVAPLLGRTTVTGWAVPLMLAAAYMDRPLLAGAMIGWAASYRVYPGFFALYLLIAMHREGYRAGRALASALATAAALNAPFLAADPALFLESFLIPYKLNLNPLDMGPGLASLGWLGIYIPKPLATAMVLAVLLGGAAVSLAYYARMKHAIFLFPALAMFLYYRPSYIYYAYFPFLAAIAYLSGRISYLDEPRRIPRGSAVHLSLLVFAAGLASALAVVEYVPETILHRLVVVIVAAGAPAVLVLAGSRLEAGERSLAALVMILVVLAAVGSGLMKQTYYIVYDLGAARSLMEAVAAGAPASAPVRAVVPSNGTPIIPQEIIAGSEPYKPPSLSPLAAVLVGALGAPATILIAGLLATAAALVLLARTRGYSRLHILAALASAPPVLLGATGLQVEELLTLTGLLIAAAGVARGGRPGTAIAALGAAAASLSSVVGPLAAAMMLGSHTWAGRKARILLALLGLAALAVVGPGFFSSVSYQGYCLGLGGHAGGIFRAIVTAPVSLAEAVLGVGMGASAASPGGVFCEYCSIHVVGALLLASALATGIRARLGCGGGRRAC